MSLLKNTDIPKSRNDQSLNILCKADVCRKLQISPSTLWRIASNGSFPASIKISLNRVGWIESEVDAWIVQKAQDRGTKQ